MLPVRIEKHPRGPRVYFEVFGRRLRLHHGLAFSCGAIACMFGAWTDRHDFPWTNDW